MACSKQNDTDGKKLAGPPAKTDDKKLAEPLAKAEKGDVVATVNGKPISRQQLDEASVNDMQMLQAQGQQLTPDQTLGFQRQVLGKLVDQELLSQAASSAKIADLDKKIEAQIAEIKGQFPNEQAFTDRIAKANRTPEQFRADVTNGVRLKEFVEQQFGSKVEVGDDKIKAFYDENPQYFQAPEMVRASHILVTVPQDATDEVKKAKRAAIDAARARVIKGEDFAKVAGEVSECPSKQNGGDLDFFGKGQMVPEFEKTTFAMKDGEVSEVVTTQFGFHIIKRTGSKEAQKRTLDTMKDMIVRFLKNREVGKQVAQFVEDQKKTAKIETFLK
jgi:peptidyl-prolyl cis-trans isomerase C